MTPAEFRTLIASKQKSNIAKEWKVNDERLTKPRRASKPKTRVRLLLPARQATDPCRSASFRLEGLPPSANTLVMPVRNRLVKAPMPRQWLETTVATLRATFPGFVRLRGPVRVAMTVYVDRVNSDASNRVKALEDAITQAGLWGDDSQVAELAVRKCIAPTDATMVEVEVRELPADAVDSLLWARLATAGL